MQAVLDYLRRVWQIIKEFWQGRERKDRMRFLLISSVALIGMIFAIIMLSRTSYGELYTGIDAAEVGEIRDILRANNVRNIVEGNTIKIPQEQVSEWRVTLAMEGYPKSGLDYSHIEGAAGFGMSDFDKQWRSVTQRQEDIRRSIMANSNVRDARVMITQPNNSGWIFASDVIPVTASVSLSLINPLSPAAVSGIISMTASAYPGLAEENVTVVDQNGFQLNPLPPGELDILASQAERVAQIERELESNLMRILTPIVGIDKSQVSVNATVNFDDVSSESVTYSPVVGNDEGIVVSLQESMEKAEGARMAGQVGGDENGGGGAVFEGTGGGAVLRRRMDSGSSEKEQVTNV
ncbi:MAG: flagellar M-ring protein FliF [Oscillospiraceae bacterium]|nr:flagellar M-ring protein FliF [Oscillospiraceae bacterium]